MFRWLTSSLRTKFALIAGSAVYLVAIAGLAGIFLLNHSLREYQKSSAELSLTQQALLNASVAFHTQVQDWHNILLRGADAAKLERYWKGFSERESETTAHLKKALGATSDPAIKTAIEAALSAHASTAAPYRKALETFKATSFDSDAADVVVTGIDRKPTELMLQAAALAEKQNLQRVDDRTRLAQRVFVLSSVLIGIIALAVVPLMLWLVNRAILSPVQRAVSIADNISKGDLTNTIVAGRNDETGKLLGALGAMQQNLASLVGAVRTSTEAVFASAGQLATGANDLSRRTQQQATSLEQTAASMEELTGSVRETADNAHQATDAASRASHSAEAGGTAVKNVVSTMNEINASAGRIGDIITVIDGIAFQTNILALNAAVEAARAGEQGRGFAVVASEVRALAQRAATAAKEIKGLIGVSLERVGAGTRQVEAAGTTITQLVDDAKRVSTLMTNIAQANREQTRSIEQVSAGVTHMDSALQHNAALVEETAAATETMRAHAHTLLEAVKRFRVSAGHASHDTAHHDAERGAPPPDAPRLSSAGHLRLPEPV